MFRQAIPVLHVTSAETARRFYYEQLGFEARFAYRLDPSRPDPCYQGFCREGAWIHASSFSGDAVVGGVVYLVVDDVDQLQQELLTRGVSIDMEPTDQDWGNREMYVKDPDGNCIRFVQEPNS